MSEIDRLKREVALLKREVEKLKAKLENAIIPKFKVGQKVYWIFNKREDCIRNYVIAKIDKHEGHFIYLDSDGTWLLEYQIFSTKEEAEQKLKELKGNL